MPAEAHSGETPRNLMNGLDKTHRYCALGAEISSNLALPELQPSNSASDALIHIQQGDQGQWPILEADAQHIT